MKRRLAMSLLFCFIPFAGIGNDLSLWISGIYFIQTENGKECFGESDFKIEPKRACLN